MALPLANIGIAITKPLSQANQLKQMIEQAGGSVISYPLIEIVPLKDYTKFQETIANLPAYDWVIFISSNAVENSMPRIMQQGIPGHLQFAAIGPSTAKKLESYHIKKVLTPNGRFDSESLLSTPELQQVKNSNILIVRGKGGRELLRETLINRGANVTYAECYQRINPQTNCHVLDDAWAQNKLQAIIVSSTEAMRHLIALAKDKPRRSQVHLFTHHPRIAEHAKDFFKTITVSTGPEDQNMLQSLCDQLIK